MILLDTSASMQREDLWQQAQAAVSRAADEAQGANMRLVVHAVSALRARRRRQDAYSLEVADGFEIDPRAAGELAPEEPTLSLACVCHDDFP